MIKNIMARYKFHRRIVFVRLNCRCLGQGLVSGSYEHGKEPSSSTKGGIFLDQLKNTNQLLNNDSIPLSHLVQMLTHGHSRDRH